MEQTKLTKDNISQWKAELGKLLFKRYGVSGHENTIPDTEWLEYYEGQTVDEAIIDEIANWEA